VRVADLTLREDPNDHRTIDRLLAFGWFADWQRPIYDLAANARVSVRNDPRPEIRFGAQGSCPRAWCMTALGGVAISAVSDG